MRSRRFIATLSDAIIETHNFRRRVCRNKRNTPILAELNDRLYGEPTYILPTYEYDRCLLPSVQPE